MVLSVFQFQQTESLDEKLTNGRYITTTVVGPLPLRRVVNLQEECFLFEKLVQAQAIQKKTAITVTACNAGTTV